MPIVKNINSFRQDKFIGHCGVVRTTWSDLDVSHGTCRDRVGESIELSALHIMSWFQTRSIKGMDMKGVSVSNCWCRLC